MVKPVSSEVGTPVGGRRDPVEDVAALIRTTVEVTADSPTGDVSMPQLLAAAGMSNKAFYQHFSSKEELWLAILRYGRGLLLERLERALAGVSTSEEAITVWTDCLLEQSRRPSVARRTRPYALARPRLMSQFPGEVLESDLSLIQPLVRTLTRISPDFPHSAAHGNAALVVLLVYEYVAEELVTRTRSKRCSAEALLAVVLGLLTVDRGAGGGPS